MELNKEEEKMIKQFRKEKEKEKSEVEIKSKKKTRRKKIQHTKLLLNITMIAFVVIGICSVYVNFKNGLGMDSIFESVCGVIKHLIPCGMAKSFLETSSEKKMRLEYAKENINYDNI